MIHLRPANQSQAIQKPASPAAQSRDSLVGRDGAEWVVDIAEEDDRGLRAVAATRQLVELHLAPERDDANAC
jgi:hypothetical protein